MIVYLDTSVILSYFDESSTFFPTTQKLLKFPNLELITGFITVLEMESVINRSFSSLSFQFDKEADKIFDLLSKSEKISAITEYFLTHLEIRIESTASIEKYQMRGVKIDVYNTFQTALRINRDLGLRTLDAIQIASAVEIRILNKVNVEFFVTNDKIILQNKQNLFQKARIVPISSEDLARVLDV
ncbi:MAG: PIN domain-containing protein [Candidatus Lokiarchaeota archaeon]|nr:PIN domain-containing protein [Candidatus Lokiarchaeota archaeon]